MGKGIVSLFKHKENDEKRSFENESGKLLIQQIQEGDVRAFKYLMREYYQQLVDFAYHYVCSTHAAKDVVQDVFANIWESRSTWSPDRSLKMYLYQSVKNEALKLLRDRKTERKYIESYLKDKGEHKIYPKEEGEEDNQEFKRAAQLAIQSLPERARMTYQLHRKNGLTYKEIARVMEVSHKTVESQMSRALRLLRARLSKYLPISMLMVALEHVFY